MYAATQVDYHNVQRRINVEIIIFIIIIIIINYNNNIMIIINSSLDVLLYCCTVNIISINSSLDVPGEVMSSCWTL